MGKLFYKIFVFLWTIWTLSSFAFILFLCFPVLVLGVTFGGPKTIRAMHSLPRICSKWAFFWGAVRVKFRNEMPFDPKGQYIFISNHNSNLDPLITSASIPNLYKFLGKAEVLKMPMFGYITRKLYTSVKRTDSGDRARSMDQLRGHLDVGACLIIYPEGTRNRTGSNELRPFKSGAFNLSIEKKVPIVALMAVNSYERMSPVNWWVHPGKMDCVWLGPFEPGEHTYETMDEFKALIKAEMGKYVKD